LKDTLETLRREQIRAVFPEDDAPDAFLETMRESAGVTIAEHLHADFLSNQGETYDQMFRANVTRIVDALAPPGGP